MADCNGRMPRPPRRSGWVTTSATSWPASRSWLRLGPANIAVPAKTIRNRALRADEFRLHLLLFRFHLAQRVETGQPVGEEDAVQVVDLVLDGARQQRVALDLHRLPLAVEPACHHLHVAFDLADVARNREAALQADLLALPLHHLRVHEGVQVGVGLDDHHAQPDAHLGCRQPDARGGDHRVHHVIDQLADAAIDTRHPPRLLAKDRRFLGEDWTDSHWFLTYMGSTSRLQPRPRGKPSATRCRSVPLSVTSNRNSSLRRYTNAGDGPRTSMSPKLSRPIVADRCSTAVCASRAARASSR